MTFLRRSRMNSTTAKKLLLIATAMLSASSMAGYTSILGISKDEYRGGVYYPTCLVDADRALNDARTAGKDKECPDEFNALQKQVGSAIKVHLGCNTEGACKMAKDVVAQANTLTCPPRPVAEKPAPKPVPVIPAPKANISVAPAS